MCYESMRISIQQAKRLPQGSFLGMLRQQSAPKLGGHVLKSLCQHVQNKPHGVVMGNVIQAGMGQAPARQSAHFADLDEDIPCMLVNKVCASSMKAIHMACLHMLQKPGIWLAGGMESLSNAPYLWPRQATASRVGKPPVQDSLLWDGLQDSLSMQAMGSLAEVTARAHGISRAMQEAYAFQSLQNAKKARDSGWFASEMVAIDGIPLTDEPLNKIKEEKFFTLSPAFGGDGTITAATASSLADGAAAVLLSPMTDDALAHIVGVSEFSCHPRDFTRAPIGAMEQLLRDIKWKTQDIDLFEINEAFATVPVMVMQHFHIERERINVSGGGCNLGHPLGASGARIVVTLAHAMKRMGLRRGVATLCVGGGEAMAVALER